MYLLSGIKLSVTDDEKLLYTKAAKKMNTPEENIKNVQDNKGDILDVYVENEILNNVRYAIDDLPEKQRIVVILHYCEEFTTEEISKILHIPKGMVLSRLAKARKIIKKEMEMKGYEV